MEKVLTATTPNPGEPPINSRRWACRYSSEQIHISGEFAFHPLFDSMATHTSNEFLNACIAYKALVGVMHNEWTIIGCSSIALVFIYKDFINLECIATPPEFRREGSANKMMKMIVRAADDSQTPIRLRACNVTGRGPSWMLPEHPAIIKGALKKGKLPVKHLVKWYEKFGFKVVAQVFEKGKADGWNMEYTPRPPVGWVIRDHNHKTCPDYASNIILPRELADQWIATFRQNNTETPYKYRIVPVFADEVEKGDVFLMGKAIV